MTKGHQFLQQEFGFTPKIGWQVDPFGHASNHVKFRFVPRLLNSDAISSSARPHFLLKWDSTRFSCTVLTIKIGYSAIKLKILNSLWVPDAWLDLIEADFPLPSPLTIVASNAELRGTNWLVDSRARPERWLVCLHLRNFSLLLSLSSSSSFFPSFFCSLFISC